MNRELPAGFEALGEVREKTGSLAFARSSSPTVLLVRAGGYVGPVLLRKDLDFARRFGEEHSEGWDYVVDTSGVRFAHPLNPLLLRQIRELPNLRRYCIVAPALFVRMLVRASRWIVKPDALLRSIEELALWRARVDSADGYARAVPPP